MRTRLRISSLFLLSLFVLSFAAAAQNPETLLPEQSAAKAKQFLQQLIAALGGPAYLNVRQSDCTGRLSFFGHGGDLTGYDYFHDLWILPDKNRTEYTKKSVIIELFTGNQGWIMDKGGVQEKPAAEIEQFQEGLKKDIDSLLRFRLNEDSMAFRYGGSDIVDLKQVDWVEIVDRDRRTFRLAIDRATHLLIRVETITRNATTRERTEEVTYFANYHVQDGVQTPFSVTRERDDRKVYQVFFYGCKYNPGLSPELFTRASLEKHYAEIPKKKKK